MQVTQEVREEWELIDDFTLSGCLARKVKVLDHARGTPPPVITVRCPGERFYRGLVQIQDSKPVPEGGCRRAIRGEMPEQSAIMEDFQKTFKIGHNQQEKWPQQRPPRHCLSPRWREMFFLPGSQEAV